MSSITVKEALYGFAGVAGVLMLAGGIAGVCTALSSVTTTLFQPALYTGLSLVAGGTIALIFSAQVLKDEEKEIAHDKIMQCVTEFFGHEHEDKV